MRRVCAWCGVDLDGNGITVEADAVVSHGICQECHASLSEVAGGIPVAEFISTLSEPVVLMNDEHSVGMVNHAALQLLGPRPEEVIGDRLGKVFDCENSHKPGGCGRTIHCSGCAIRQAVASTHASGEPRLNVPATVRSVRSPDRDDIELVISTVRVGERILLKIDSYQDRTAAKDGAS